MQKKRGEYIMYNMDELRKLFSGKRVLVVEDNELNREIAQEILKEAGLSAEAATDGKDAVQMVEESPEGYYDAILMDIQMRIMNGYDATIAIRALDRKDTKIMPIIAMSANMLEHNKKAAMENGMSAYIPKPMDIDKFISVLADSLL